jgi:hypothetical protein
LWVLEVRSPRRSSVALPCLISFGNSSTVIFVGHDVFF